MNRWRLGKMRSHGKSNGVMRMLLAGLFLLLGSTCMAPGADSGEQAPPAGSYDWMIRDDDPEPFKQEMVLAWENRKNRDERVLHFQKALDYRPNDPGNLAVECYIVGALSTYWDPENPQPLRREEALKVVEGILEKYKHMDYYSARVSDGGSTTQFMVPQAAVWGACLERALNRDNAKAREYTLLAMNCLNDTCRQRIKDWQSEPAPPADSPLVSELTGVPKQEARVEDWRKKQEAAATGDVLGPAETGLVEAAVRQYGYTYGPQRPEEVSIAMNEVIRLFPGTPMAKVAQGHIDRAGELAMQSLADHGIDELPDTIPLSEVLQETPAETAAAETLPADQSTALQDGASERLWPFFAAIGCIAAVILAYGAVRRAGKKGADHDRPAEEPPGAP